MSSNIQRSTITSTAEDQTVHKNSVISKVHATNRTLTEEPHAGLNVELVNDKSYILYGNHSDIKGGGRPHNEIFSVLNVLNCQISA